MCQTLTKVAVPSHSSRVHSQPVSVTVLQAVLFVHHGVGSTKMTKMSQRRRARTLLGTKGIATRSKGLTSNKKLVETIYKLEFN